MNKKLSRWCLVNYMIALLASVFVVLGVQENIHNVIFNIGSVLSIIINIIIFIIKKKNKNEHYNYFLIVLSLDALGLIFNLKIVTLALIVLSSFFLNIDLINVSQFIKLDIISKIIIFLSAFFLNIIGVLSPTINGLYDGFGFEYANNVGTIILSIITSLMLWNYIHFKIYNKSLWILSILSSLLLIIIFYYLTKSRALLICGLFILLFIGLKRTKIVQTIIFHTSTIISFLIIAFSLIIPYLFNPISDTWNTLNNLLSNRLAMQALYIKLNPLGLFGHVINRSDFLSFGNLLNIWNINSYNDVTIDNFYFSTAYFYGLIGIGLILFFMFKALHQTIKFHEYVLCIILFSLMIYSAIESDTIWIYNIAPFLYVFAYNDKKSSGTLQV